MGSDPMSPTNNSSPQRAIRFSPDLNTVAWIKFSGMDEDALPELVALVYNESFKGCSLILVVEQPISVGEIVRLRVGKLQPLPAKVAWVNILEDKVIRAGFEYLE